MKIIFYILFILILPVSALDAQNEIEVNNIETKISISQAKQTTVIIDTIKIRETIARSNSDIRIFFNMEKKVKNIKLVFPKINTNKFS